MRKNVIVASGLYAGLVSGAIYALLLIVFVKPFIYAAEIAAGEEASITGKYIGTLIGTVLVGSALGLVLAALYDRSGLKYKNWRSALVLGGAGWLVFNFFPAIAYPPNPPGVHGGLNLAVKQQWWLIVLAAGAAAVALSWYLYTSLNIGNAILKAALAIAPSVTIMAAVTALRPAENVRPPSLSTLFLTEFRLASLSTGLVFWLALGLTTAYFYHRYDVDSQ